MQPFVTDYDVHLLAEGRHLRSYEKLGAHLVEVDGVAGVHFAVWAPNASRVTVIGDFNGWNPDQTPLVQRPDGGVWEAMVPQVAAGTRYKYRVVSRDGSYISDRADPYGFAGEIRPDTASVIVDLGTYQWQDGEWMAGRAAAQRQGRPDRSLRSPPRFVEAGARANRTAG